MQNLYLAMTLGGDPHTEGARKAGRIANMLGIDFKMLPPDMPDGEKIKIIKSEKPVFLGMSYRLSPEKAINELNKFMIKLDDAGCIGHDYSYACFAGLLPSLDLVRKVKLNQKYHLDLIGSYSSIEKTTGETVDFFRTASVARRKEIIQIIKKEAEPEKIEILDQIAKDAIRDDLYLLEKPLPVPSAKACKSLRVRIRESDIPVIRTHFGVPDETIEPTVKGIMKIAENKVIDELSLGSSDLSQRYYGRPDMFVNRRNDGGVPYKTREDLEKIFRASRNGNFPAVKPYCHVTNIIPFIDECLSIGMLQGGHQAIPLFWFNELDGRGPMTVSESIDEHLKAVKYLAKRNIPVEMNDPNQWSSRLVHDTLFVTSYCLILSIMYEAGVKDIVLQCQFNKPATTGDYADLAKMTTVQYFAEQLRPIGNKANIFYEGRTGIEYFSTDLNIAKFQLARSTLLQMLINPSILHLVSYCEAEHIALADDIIESSKILRRAVRLFKENEDDIRREVKWDIVDARCEFLREEVNTVLCELVALSGQNRRVGMREISPYLAMPETLKDAMRFRIMTAPGITNRKYENPSLLTKVGEHGMVDCYKNWDDKMPMREAERLAAIKKEFSCSEKYKGF